MNIIKNTKKKLFQKILSQFSIYQSKDHHNGLHLKLQNHVQIQDFQKYFQEVMHKQKQLKNTTLWIHLNQNNMGLIQYILQQKFKIHHGFDQKIVLYKWLNHQINDLVPKYSLFYVACGAVVINNNKILLVQQSNGPRKDSWGVPGGLCDYNQQLANGTERELKQQTNLTGKYKYMIYFREFYSSSFRGADFYFANLVKIENEQQKNIKLCRNELKGYKWIRLEQLQQFIQGHKVEMTQKKLLQYIKELHDKKFDFYNQKPNTTTKTQMHYEKIKQGFIQHKLIKQR